MNGKAKILLVDSCYEADSLSQYEFVRPVQRILERTGFPCQVCHISLLNEERLKSCDKVVLCGTALKDNEYLNHLERYTWLKEGDRPVLGICAGMQQDLTDHGCRGSLAMGTADSDGGFVILHDLT